MTKTVDTPRAANGIRFVTFTVLIVALLACVWALVLGVKLTIDSSVPGGVAVVLIAVVLLGGIGWRIRIKWSELHDRS